MPLLVICLVAVARGSWALRKVAFARVLVALAAVAAVLVAVLLLFADLDSLVVVPFADLVCAVVVLPLVSVSIEPLLVKEPLARVNLVTLPMIV